MKQYLMLTLLFQFFYTPAMLHKLQIQKKAINAIFYHDSSRFDKLCQSKENQQVIINYRTINNESLLHLAASHGAAPIIKKLIKIEANPKDTNNKGETASVFAKKCFKLNASAYLKKLTGETLTSVNLLQDNADYETILLYNMVMIRIEIKRIEKILTNLQGPLILDQK